jgi:hypothetical protein
LSNENFRRDLNGAFDQISGSPSPLLRDRVRSAVAEAPEARGPYWIAAMAACVIAVLIVGVLFVSNPLKRQSPITGGPVSSPTASSATSQSPSPSPSASPTAQQPAFVCTIGTAAAHSSTAPVAFISGLRTGSHAGYDRLTIDFSNGGPSGSVDLKPQSGTAFTSSPSGMSTTLKGSKGILVTVHGADLHSAYSGSLDIVTGYATLVEVKRVEDFEGVVQLGLGMNGTGCYRAFWLSNPDRLVIDVQAAS